MKECVKYFVNYPKHTYYTEGLTSLLTPAMTPPILLLLLLLTPARSSQQDLLHSQVHLPDWSQVLQLTRVSQASWQSGRLAPTTEQSLVNCAASCVQKNKADGSCDSIMFVKAARECHMGTAGLVEEGQASDTVYRIGGETTT